MDSAADSDEITTPAPSPTPPTMAIFAEGWNGILITANYAKTTVDKVGHWVTTRNACGKDADGAIELDFWNRLAEAVNKSIATEPLAESRCSPIPTDSKMDGTVDAMLQQRGVRTLLEVRDNEICTTIKDPQVAAELIDAVSKIVDIADKEDCPNGWGSG